MKGLVNLTYGSMKNDGVSNGKNFVDLFAGYSCVYLQSSTMYKILFTMSQTWRVFLQILRADCRFAAYEWW